MKWQSWNYTTKHRVRDISLTGFNYPGLNLSDLINSKFNIPAEVQSDNADKDKERPQKRNQSSFMHNPNKTSTHPFLKLRDNY